ncbi:MAG TPA: acyl-CoA dehydrogenase family protein [Burkholderiales bacterium]|jgi:alkylation response protein AidB-like acyl-CoA dehydrogenase|nr:acyl-CoA dehydrogenase family protein [Burkholderiales bacterium]
MDFSFTDEQHQLRDSLRRYLANEYSFDARKKIIHGAGSSEAAWAGFAELGLLGVPLPEEYGGFGGGGVDLLVVMEELGRGLVVEPYFATAVLGAALLRFGGGGAQAQALLPGVADGSLKLAAALTEAQSRHELFNVTTSAKAGANGHVLNGAKTVVLHGAQAHKLIVSARSGGGPRDTAGLTLFVIEAKAPGVSVTDYRTIDGMRAADVTLINVAVGHDAVLGRPGQGWDVIERAAEVGMAALVAEAVGAMDALHEATLEYLKTRQQFGVPIGRFQVLQHRAVEMFMEIEQARSLAYLAAVKLDGEDATERACAVHAAKARAGRALKFVGQSAIQMHGGMGMTDELPASHYFKRLSMIELTLGDTDHHLAAFAALQVPGQATVSEPGEPGRKAA